MQSISAFQGYSNAALLNTTRRNTSHPLFGMAESVKKLQEGVLEPLGEYQIGRNTYLVEARLGRGGRVRVHIADKNESKATGWADIQYYPGGSFRIVDSKGDVQHGHRLGPGVSSAFGRLKSDAETIATLLSPHLQPK